jgi:IS5 family transposase
VRARIDWKYLLGLELADPGFDHSVLCEFRSRLVGGGAEERLLGRLLEACQVRGLLKARGRQRTDATHVLAAIRVLNRLELVGETLRAALNELAAVAPDWLRAAARRPGTSAMPIRVEDHRLPRAEAEREAYARAVGEDGFALLARLDEPGAAEGLRRLPRVEALRQVWARHFVREPAGPPAGGGGVRLRGKADPVGAGGRVALRSRGPLPRPARHRLDRLRRAPERDLRRRRVHLITHAMTTDASVNEVRCTAAIQRALAGKGLAPSEHLVDTAYVGAGLVVRSREELGIALIGPSRSDASWQAKLGDGHGLERFEVDWERERVRCCPQGRLSSAWSPLVERSGRSYVRVLFRKSDCSTCPAQPLCTRARHRARYLKLQPRAEHEALKAGRERLATKEGRRAYARRAGVEGTISQGVRAFGLRRSRYRGLAKTHLQHVATAAAIDLVRLGDWLRLVPRAVTRTSRCATLTA